jgi:hypothetical protein
VLSSFSRRSSVLCFVFIIIFAIAIVRFSVFILHRCLRFLSFSGCRLDFGQEKPLKHAVYRLCCGSFARYVGETCAIVGQVFDQNMTLKLPTSRTFTLTSQGIHQPQHRLASFRLAVFVGSDLYACCSSYYYTQVPYETAARIVLHIDIKGLADIDTETTKKMLVRCNGYD